MSLQVAELAQWVMAGCPVSSVQGPWACADRLFLLLEPSPNFATILNCIYGSMQRICSQADCIDKLVTPSCLCVWTVIEWHLRSAVMCLQGVAGCTTCLSYNPEFKSETRRQFQAHAHKVGAYLGCVSRVGLARLDSVAVHGLACAHDGATVTEHAVCLGYRAFGRLLQ